MKIVSINRVISIFEIRILISEFSALIPSDSGGNVFPPIDSSEQRERGNVPLHRSCLMVTAFHSASVEYVVPPMDSSEQRERVRGFRSGSSIRGAASARCPEAFF
jgi:hypothetical protein